MTAKRRLRIKKIIEGNCERADILLCGIGDVIKRAWDLAELQRLVRIIVEEAIPLRREAESLNKLLGARTQKSPKRRKTAQKSAKSKGK